MALVDAAVAHCARNEQGLVRLADLWASRAVSNWNLSEVRKKNPELAESIVVVRQGERSKTGSYASEATARQIAQRVPTKYLWRAQEEPAAPHSESPAIEPALGHCRRDGVGRLKLGDLWADAYVAKKNSYLYVARLPQLAPTVEKVMSGPRHERGLYAQESTARAVAELIPARHLWRAPEDPRTAEVLEEDPEAEDAAEASNAVIDASPAAASDRGGAGQSPEVGETAEPRRGTAIATRNFKGLVIERRDSDGYFNGTNLCAAFKKRFQHYLETQRVSEYLDALAHSLISTAGIPALDFDQARDYLVQVQHGGANRGSWIHERVAVDLARWLSPDFAVWMDGWVLEGLGLSSEPSVPAASTPPAIVEQAFVPRKPLIIQDDNSVGLPGSDHLYAALRVGENIIKVGISKDVLERLKSLSQQFQGKYELLAVWPNECALEDIVLDLLKPAKTPIGSSREHFNANASFEYICQIVQAARNLYKLKMDLDASTSKRKREEIEFQEDLAERAITRKRAEAGVEAELARIEGERARIETEKTREGLIHELVRERNADAVRVFLSRLGHSL